MHGRLKVRTSEEQAEAKRLEQKEKLKFYLSITGKIFSKRENKEDDEESLALTATLLEKNPDFYTLWNYRREVLLKLKDTKTEDELKKLCLEELHLTQNCLTVNPKSYSTWHHRMWSMDFNPEGDWNRELKLCNFFLSQDERNFHCWDYRRIVSRKCNVSPAAELDYSTSLIEANFSNYSAWHYRSTLLPLVHWDAVTKSVKEEILLKEFDYIQNAAFTDPDDQSVWFYHRWLLGRCKTPLQFLSVSVFKPQNLVVILLSECIKGDGLTLEINGSVIPVDWSSVDDSPAATMWKCELPQENLQPGDKRCSVTVSISTDQDRCSLSCDVNGSKSFVWKKATRADAFRSDFSAAAKEVLERELESCLQLNELEPNCKWTLFTCVLLMRALNKPEFQKDIVEYMDKLMEVDKLRKNYYRDLGSKFSIEDVIENLPTYATEISFSGARLYSLHHFDQLFLIEKIDLSSNSLESLHPIRFLVCVRTVNLDDNTLSDLEGIEKLENLEQLSVRRNCLKKASVFAALKDCPSLQELNAEGNPATEDPDYLLTLRTIPTLMLIDGVGL